MRGGRRRGLPRRRRRGSSSSGGALELGPTLVKARWGRGGRKSSEGGFGKKSEAQGESSTEEGGGSGRGGNSSSHYFGERTPLPSYERREAEAGHRPDMCVRVLLQERRKVRLLPSTCIFVLSRISHSFLSFFAFSFLSSRLLGFPSSFFFAA